MGAEGEGRASAVGSGRRRTAADVVGGATGLEAVLPEWDVNELHSKAIPVPPAVAWAALGATTGGEIRLLAPLMALRQLPAMLAGRRPRRWDGDRPAFAVLEGAGFARLAEVEGREVVFGVVGRFWSPAGNQPLPGLDDARSFTSFDAPGYAKAAMGFVVDADGHGSRLVTETRVAGTDAVAARHFRRYWRLVRPGSGAIRRSWLAAVARRALAIDAAGGAR